MADNPLTSLPAGDLKIMHDTFEVIEDRLRHYPDGEMDWDSSQVGEFWALSSLLRDACKEAGFWWAR